VSTSKRLAQTKVVHKVDFAQQHNRSAPSKI